MTRTRDRVVVAMSGGVDSSVAAALLVEQGYDVMGLFMRVGVEAADEACPTPDGRPLRSHQGCCSASDAADARFVAGMLGIPFFALNFQAQFDDLIDYFADEYAQGRTPNPCVVCNNRLKFGRIVAYADAVGARYIATGHYARIDRSGDPLGGVGDPRTGRRGMGKRSLPVADQPRSPSGWPTASAVGQSNLDCRRADDGDICIEPRGRSRLLRAIDSRKDQSYVLFGLGRSVLDRVLFPIGHLHKTEVRAIAARYGFPNQNKPDSVEICFVPDRNYARIVRERRPEAFVPGEVLDSTGQVIGRHGGIAHFTIGQRRGLGIAAGTPRYVTGISVEARTVTLGTADELLAEGLIADRVNLLVDSGRGSFRAEAKIRYLHTAAPCNVERLGGARMRVTFDEPQRAVTPGQAVVLYDGDVVLGGGWIERAERSGAAAAEAARCAATASEHVFD